MHINKISLRKFASRPRGKVIITYIQPSHSDASTNSHLSSRKEEIAVSWPEQFQFSTCCPSSLFTCPCWSQLHSPDLSTKQCSLVMCIFTSYRNMSNILKVHRYQTRDVTLYHTVSLSTQSWSTTSLWEIPKPEALQMEGAKRRMVMS